MLKIYDEFVCRYDKSFIGRIFEVDSAKLCQALAFLECGLAVSKNISFLLKQLCKMQNFKNS
jgi:hypothetical protein